MLCKAFARLFDVTLPTGLLTASEDPQVRLKFGKVITQSILQLMLIQTLHELLNVETSVFDHLSTECILSLATLLKRSYTFAKSFNDDLPLRQRLYQTGVMKNLPNLLRQEATSIESYLTLLMKLFEDEREGRRTLEKGIEADLHRFYLYFITCIVKAQS